MRAVVHVGMSKTGSTAIQHAFHGRATPEYEYLESVGINHLGLLRLIHPGLADGDSAPRPEADAGAGAEADARGARARARFAAQLDRLAPTDRTLIVSSEALWSPQRAGLRAALLADLAARGARIEALGYVRPPLSHAVSGFQQRLKRFERPARFDLARLHPSYRAAIEGLDRSFGRDRVRLRLFARAALAGGDVVRDFAEAIGVPVPPPKGEPPRHNESLGAEAVAVLYAHLRDGPSLDLEPPRAAAEARRLIGVLRRLGSRRLTFAPAAWREVLGLHREDLAWTEARLGCRIVDAAEPDAAVVATEEDVLRLAQTVAAHEATREFGEGLATLRAAQAAGARAQATLPAVTSPPAIRPQPREGWRTRHAP